MPSKPCVNGVRLYNLQKTVIMCHNAWSQETVTSSSINSHLLHLAASSTPPPHRFKQQRLNVLSREKMIKLKCWDDATHSSAQGHCCPSLSGGPSAPVESCFYRAGKGLMWLVITTPAVNVFLLISCCFQLCCRCTGHLRPQKLPQITRHTLCSGAVRHWFTMIEPQVFGKANIKAFIKWVLLELLLCRSNLWLKIEKWALIYM